MAINRTSPKKGKVVDIPTAIPTIGTATAAEGAASITFTAPEITVGGPITYYQMKSNPGNFTGTGTTSPIIVNGLTNDTPHTFTVAAGNSTGIGEYSSASNSATPIAAPLPPVSGYTVLLDANDSSTITTSSGAVTQWVDKSANGYVFSQGTSTQRPTFGTNTINGRNVVTFDGVNDSLISTAASSTWKFMHSTQYTVFTVLKKTGGDGTVRGILATNWAGSSAEIGTEISLNSSNQYYVFMSKGASGQYIIADGGGTLSTSTVIRTDVFDPENATDANRWKLYINNAAALTPNTRGAAITTNNPSFTLRVGSAYTDGGGPFNGHIAEIIIYPSMLSDANRESVRNYLNTKWGAY
jgi:hypothetical protein